MARALDWWNRQRGSAGAVACGGALVAAVGLTALAGGGFGAASQSAFVAFAGVALLLTASLQGEATLAATRAPPAWLLGALGALSVASAVWTIGAPVVSIRWGMTIAGYGAVLVAAAVFVRRYGPWPLAIFVAVLAAVEAGVGLRALALHALPDAEPIAGVWRPGGTFQYPPALAILEVGAIPIFACCLARRAPLALGLSVTGALLAGAAIGLCGSRLSVGLAVVLGILLVLCRRVPGCSRAAALVTIGLVLAGGAAGRGLLTGERGVRSPGSAAPVSWIPRARVGRSRPDLLHGRAREWDAALRTWLEHPLLGAGSGAYYRASLPYQGGAPTLYAHDLPLELAAELGVLGLALGVGLYIACARALALALARGRIELTLFGGLAVVFLVSNLLDWTWHLAGLGALWALAVGGVVGGARRAGFER